MVQVVDANDDAAESKPRKKKPKGAKTMQKRAKAMEMRTRSWPGRVMRSLLAVAGIGLILGVGAMLGRASARA